MSDELVLYPPELPTDLASILADAHTLDVRRLGRGSRVVHRVNLTTDGKVVAHGSRTDRTDDDVAAEVWTAALDDANTHCKGHASYKVTATYAKPPRGATASPESIELRVGDDTRSETQLKGDWTVQLLSERSMLFKQHIELLSGTTRLANAVSTMVVGLSDALSRVTEREREIASDQTAREEIRQQAAADRERMKLLEKFAIPAMQMFRKKMGVTEAPKAAAAAIDATPAIVVKARKLGASLSAEQLQHAALELSSPRLAELATVADEQELLELYTWLSEQEMSALMSVSGRLTDAQAPLLDALHAWAAEQADKVEQARQRALEHENNDD